MNVLDHLVEEGLFLDRQEIFRDSLRRTFRAYGLKPFREFRETEGEDEKVAEDVASS